MEQYNAIIIICMTSGISLIMGLYMLFLFKSTGAKGTVYWAAGSLIIGVAILIMLVPPSGGFIGTAIPFLLITIGLYIYLAGIWDFKEKSIKKWIVIGFPLMDIIQYIIFFHFTPSVRTRVVLHAFIVVIYCSIAIYEMLKLDSKQKYLKNIFRVNAVAFFVYLTILTLRALETIFSANYTPLQIDVQRLVMFIIINFLMLALTFGFLSAVNLQFHSELKDQLKAKSKFFAIIAHDLRNPIGTIMNYLELLNNEPDLKEEERRHFLKKTETLSKSTVHLLQNLFEWAATSINKTNTEYETVEIDKLISSNIELFKSITSLKAIHFDYNPAHNLFVNGNAKMIETVLRNLVSNASKFTPKGGKITITIENNSGKVRITVSDTGIGIEPERIKTLFSFEKSKSTKGTAGETGSGFGLAVCNEFVKNNSGTMQIESEINKGTKVIIEFPAVN